MHRRDDVFVGVCDPLSLPGCGDRAQSFASVYAMIWRRRCSYLWLLAVEE